MMACALGCESSNKMLNSEEDSLAVKIVEEFYDWYINEAYPKSTSYYQVPSYKKLNNTTYVFDVKEYKKRINTINYFSEAYKEKLVNRLENCNHQMRKVEWEYEPEPMFNIDACNYLWGNQWVGGQGEKISGFKIDAINSNGSEVTVMVSILTGDKVFVRSKVLLNEREKKYLIQDIELEWN